MATHTLSVLVENKPGVLTRVAALFARRGFNINSLAVGPTEHPAISRITAVVDVEDHPLEQVTKQLNKLINVLKVVELDNQEGSVQRDLLLVKVAADATTRSQVTGIADLFRAHIVDVSQETLVIEATGTDSKLGALLTLLEPFGIRELVKSGTVGIGRGAKRITDRALERALE
ncbi:MAG: acetolactate synthase small subunit [Bifidobacteriaceae bacterium]|jgi:acetolactate synthase-1/3 small subunit|nr:acetolactate synthase small subunit [Bifidobacteriaceae bacterium]